jgi:hypothetical protein
LEVIRETAAIVARLGAPDLLCCDLLAPIRTKVLLHYYPFARSPYAPIQFTSVDKVPGTFSFSVDEADRRIQNVIAGLERVDSGKFDRTDVRLVIRFSNGEFVAVDSKGGVLNNGKEGRLSDDRVREVAATLEAMPENPYARVISN